MEKVNEMIQNYLNERALRKKDSIRLKERIKTDSNDYWEKMTVVDIIEIKGNKVKLQSIDGDTATVDIKKLKYENV